MHDVARKSQHTHSEVDRFTPRTWGPKLCVSVRVAVRKAECGFVVAASGAAAYPPSLTSRSGFAIEKATQETLS